MCAPKLGADTHLVMVFQPRDICVALSAVSSLGTVCVGHKRSPPCGNCCGRGPAVSAEQLLPTELAWADGSPQGLGHPSLPLRAHSHPSPQGLGPFFPSWLRPSFPSGLGPILPLRDRAQCSPQGLGPLFPSGLQPSGLGLPELLPPHVSSITHSQYTFVTVSDAKVTTT